MQYLDHNEKKDLKKKKKKDLLTRKNLLCVIFMCFISIFSTPSRPSCRNICSFAG